MPSPDTAPMGPLAAATMQSLAAYFETRGHRPSSEHCAALADIANTLEAMADCKCEPKVFLSAIDPGVGKTQTVVHFVRALAASQAHRDIGMIVCVGRIAEAEAVAAELQDIPASFAVLVQDGHPANDLGCGNPVCAQVLLTTQQRIEHATNGRCFDDVASLFFNGAPRQVRTWDEAWLPGVPVVLRADDLGFLLTPAQTISPTMNEAIWDLQVKLKAASTNDLIDVPDFESLCHVTVHELLAAVAGRDSKPRDDQAEVARALFTLAGTTARVMRSAADGSAFLTYSDTLPNDIAPLVVLDASGRVRQTYAYLEAHRGLQRLRVAAKDYTPLTVHVWKRGGGKESFRKHGDEITKGIAATIQSKPGERWLIVAHKASRGIRNMETELRRALPKGAMQHVQVITWGQHQASNQYSDVPNVVLAGTLFMRASFYVALTHLAQALPTSPGFANETDVALIRRGENANFILQALCRGRVRKLNGSQCFPMDAYVIADAKSGIPEDISRVFPGAHVVDWKPIPRALNGRPKQALEATQAMLEEGMTWIPFNGIANRIGMDATNFRKHVAGDAAWLTATSALGLMLGTGPRGAKGLQAAVVEREAA